MQGQYMIPYQHVQNSTSPPRQVAPQSGNPSTQYAVIQKNTGQVGKRVFIDFPLPSNNLSSIIWTFTQYELMLLLSE